MERVQKSSLLSDLKDKMIFLAGPRQVGKTWLSENLLKPYIYLNWDDEDDKRTILKKSWSRDTELIIFDELHKRSKWKSWIKGIYDKEKNLPPILATGSAKMNIFRKGSDSLAGRYFLHRLYPFSIRELVLNGENSTDAMNNLLLTGGFPEPYLKNSEQYAKRWRKTHIERIITEDLMTLDKIHDISKVELLIEFISQRVGKPVSYSSLAGDLSVSPHTIKKWITVLEELFIVFTIRPYAKRLQRSLVKEPKIYFYDIGRIPRENESERLENLAAICLLKRAHFLEDTKGETNTLYYVRDREKREVDFLTTRDGKEEYLIEIKTSDETPSPSLKFAHKRFEAKETLQLVRDISVAKNYENIKVVNFAQWLAELEI